MVAVWLQWIQCAAIVVVVKEEFEVACALTLQG